MRHRKGPTKSRENAANDIEHADHRETIMLKQHRLRPGAWMMAVLAVYVATTVFMYCPQQSLFTVSWNDFSQDYQQRYKRTPPDTLKQWLDFAVSHDCETMQYYNVIERDLAVFRDRELHYDQVVNEVTNYSDYHVVLEIQDNTLTFVRWKRPFDMTWWKQVEAMYLRYCLRWLLRPLIQHKPSIATTFVFNLHDGPIKKENAPYPIFSSCHGSHDNDNLVYDNRTMSSIERDNTITQDVVVPYYFSIGPIGRGLWFWPLYSRGPPWKQRKNTITWRGSTTGKWGDSPRFWLLQLYGRNGVHSFGQTNVDVDFAFTRVVQNYRGQELPSKYRRADSVSYRDIQQYKYVLDVDGNGMYHMKAGCGLLMELTRLTFSHLSDSFYGTLSQVAAFGIARVQVNQV